MNALIQKLTESFGPSGAEDPIRAVIRAEIEALADEIRVDPLGSLVVYKAGSGQGKRILLDAHMDEIGVIAAYIDENGFVRFTQIGGLYPLALVGSRVAFGNGTVGVIGYEHKSVTDKIPSLDQLYIDVGATDREDCPVRIGDPAVFSRPFVSQGSRLLAKAMDDRIGCAMLIETLRRLDKSPHDVYLVFSVQEETTLSGARTSAYGIDPDLAIAVDVTDTGDTPECLPMAVRLGEGPAIKVQDSGMIAHPSVRDLMVQRAKAAGTPYQLEVLVGGTTDAAAMQLVRAGVPTGCLSIPCRYVHTPSEMVDANDVEHGVQLLLEILQST
ncbi:MAG: M42 family metallopeptidase [Chloroflexi bacterium]|nr:M42 family metallopeptidase [Chloroflexota bacterium]